MKREILFRGKAHPSVSVYDKEGNKIDWVEGDLIQYRIDEWYIMPQNSSLWDVYEGGIRVDPTTVGQYTGLTDKSGVKIFEGDVVLSNTLSGEHWGEDLKEYTIGFYYGAYCFMTEGNPVRQWEDGTNDWYSIENCYLHSRKTI